MVFNEGDRVMCVEDVDDNGMIIGKFGTVAMVENGQCLVVFDVDVDGHDGGGAGAERHCWWCPCEALELENFTLENE